MNKNIVIFFSCFCCSVVSFGPHYCNSVLDGEVISSKGFSSFMLKLNERLKAKVGKETRDIALRKLIIDEKKYNEYRCLTSYFMWSEFGLRVRCGILRIFLDDTFFSDYFLFPCDFGSNVRLLVLKSTKIFSDYFNSSEKEWLELCNNINDWISNYTVDISDLNLTSLVGKCDDLKAFVIDWRQVGAVTYEEVKSLYNVSEFEGNLRDGIFKLSDWVRVVAQKYPKIL